MELLQSNSGHYYYSEGRGNPIVFLHGFPDCPENYKDHISNMNHISETDKLNLPENTIYIDTNIDKEKLESIVLNIIR